MHIVDELKSLIAEAVDELFGLKDLPDIIIERPKQKEHGDFATNFAMVAAGKAKTKPRDLAEKLQKHLLNTSPMFEKIEIAGPGFINFVLKRERYLRVLDDISKEEEDYGKVNVGRGERVQVEFVSANPTGPLHVGHGRGAVYGDALSTLLEHAGYDVVKEYYLNDAGNQMFTLGRSVFLRMKEIGGENVEFPQECYQGGYIKDIASEIMSSAELMKKLAKMEEKEKILWCGAYAGDKIPAEIKSDLKSCGIEHDTYFSELSLYERGEVKRVIDELRAKDFAYDSEGAVWFRSTAFGDEKDRVLRKSTGEFTYFASDIAYHLDKYGRGFSRVIDIWGADHGGHITRMKGAMQAFGRDPSKLDVVLIQLVNLIRGGEMVSMSTRSATYETLSQLVADLGADVCRYFFLSRSHNAQLDFDLELARKQGPENPVYYIQYANARISSIFRKAAEEKIFFEPGMIDLKLLDLEEEARLAIFLGEFPLVIKSAAETLEPHKISFYLLEFARLFQFYYTRAKLDERYKVISGSPARIHTKLYLLKNIQIVLKNGLNLLGITAPEEMIREVSDG